MGDESTEFSLEELAPQRSQVPPVSVRRPTQLSEEIARYLREQIMLGRYLEGDHVNIERLAKEINTSTTPVREALLALRSEGFVDLEPRKGFRIARLRREDVHDIGLLMRTVAGELAARAASALTSEDLGRLHTLQDLMRRAHAHGALEEVEELDFKFHRAINRSSQSPKLHWILGILGRYFPSRTWATLPGWADAAIDHERILDALSSHDDAAAREAVAQHLTVAEDMLLARLASAGAHPDQGLEASTRSSLTMDLP